ncbi:MAG: hypothetical protein R3B07_35385 [Polyangiaceae bacterium]
MNYRFKLSVVALLSLAPVACSDDGGGGGSGGNAGTGASAGTAGTSNSGGAAGKNGNSGGAASGGAASGGAASGGAASGGAASGGAASGGATSGGAGNSGGSGGSDGVGEQGKCELPTALGSCAQAQFCVEYYDDLGLDLEQACADGGGTYSTSPCSGTIGWCEAASGPYVQSIQFFANADALKTACEDKGGVWCDAATQ